MYRDYISETDYPIVLEAAKLAGEIFIAPITFALNAVGVHGLSNADRRPSMIALDRDIGRAWKELGYKNS